MKIKKKVNSCAISPLIEVNIGRNKPQPEVEYLKMFTKGNDVLQLRNRIMVVSMGKQRIFKAFVTRLA